MSYNFAMNEFDLGTLNRPMLEGDLPTLTRNPHAQSIRSMVREYARQALPVMNGSFEYCNLREGVSQSITCSPYRLWEYSSLFLHQTVTPATRVLDVGGAASPLPYYLAELGAQVTATDLQPVLVTVCNDVANHRSIPLRAVVQDITEQTPNESVQPFDLVTCISVLEHIEPEVRGAMLRAIRRLMRPDSLFYLTFDYGDFQETTTYHESGETSSAIPDLVRFVAELEQAGFSFLGNDPRTLPETVVSQRSSPGHARITRQRRLLTDPFDMETRWRTVIGYLYRRLFPPPSTDNRLAHHNFFRMFLRIT